MHCSLNLLCTLVLICGLSSTFANTFIKFRNLKYAVPNSRREDCPSWLRCSVLYCASRCSCDTSCRSFSYSEMQRECVFNSWHVASSSAYGISDPQWSTFDRQSSACDSQPCQNGGACTTSITGAFTCQCVGGYTGDVCETAPESSACDSQPCQNGGACTTSITGAFTCQCVGGYTGDVCETAPAPTAFRNCQEVLQSGSTTNGVYTVLPDGVTSIDVYCDQVTDGGGWVVFQRRQDGSQDFDLSLQQYKDGFGGLLSEFWLGMDKIYAFTSRWTHDLRVEVGSSPTNTRSATYSSFNLDAGSYNLRYGSFTGGTAGNCLADQKNNAFSKPATDSSFCGQLYYGAWWFGQNCYYCNLNGRYGATNGGGVKWHTDGGSATSHAWVEMKMRPSA